jgi:hypothetical protein
MPENNFSRYRLCPIARITIPIGNLKNMNSIRKDLPYIPFLDTGVGVLMYAGYMKDYRG